MPDPKTLGPGRCAGCFAHWLTIREGKHQTRMFARDGTQQVRVRALVENKKFRKFNLVNGGIK